MPKQVPNKVSVSFTGNIPECLSALKGFLAPEARSPSPEVSDSDGAPGAGDIILEAVSRLMTMRDLPEVDALMHQGQLDQDGIARRMVIYGRLSLAIDQANREDTNYFVNLGAAHAAGLLEKCEGSWVRRKTLYFFDSDRASFVYAFVYVRIADPGFEGDPGFPQFDPDDIPTPEEMELN